MEKFNFSEDEQNILIKLGFKIEIDSKGNQIALYDVGYERYMKVEKDLAPINTRSSKIFIFIRLLNRNDSVLNEFLYDSKKITKMMVIIIKKIILQLHKVELDIIVEGFND